MNESKAQYYNRFNTIHPMRRVGDNLLAASFILFNVFIAIKKHKSNFIYNLINNKTYKSWRLGLRCDRTIYNVDNHTLINSSNLCTDKNTQYLGDLDFYSGNIKSGKQIQDYIADNVNHLDDLNLYPLKQYTFTTTGCADLYYLEQYNVVKYIHEDRDKLVKLVADRVYHLPLNACHIMANWCGGLGLVNYWIKYA